MAYPNPPKTWAAAEKLTAVLLNAQLRDALLALQAGTWGADRTFVRKPASEDVTNSAALQNDDHLLFAAASNATYKFELGLLVSVTGGSSTSDLQVGWSLPSGTWAGGVNAADPAMAGGGTTGASQWLGVTGAVGASIPVGLGGANTQLVMIHGTIVTAGVAGNCNLRWAQNTAVAVTTSVLGGSWLDARRVA